MENDLILVVEDNDSFLFNLQLLLEQNGYDVVTAKNGKSALNLLQNTIKKPNLIVSDIVMPEMDGYKLFQKVSGNFNWNMIPFIFLSAKATSEEIRFGRLLGVDDYLTKPIDVELLLSMIKNKIQKVRKIELDLKTKIESELISEIDQFISINQTSSTINQIQLFLVKYDNEQNLKVIKEDKNDHFKTINIEQLIIKLFQIIESLFSEQKILSPNSLLINIEAIRMKSLVLFGQKFGLKENNTYERFMLCIIAPEITYLDSLKLKDALMSYFDEFKNYGNLNLKICYNEVESILS